MGAELAVQSQEFWSQALPVFVGAISAFLLSMVAFLIRNALNAKNERKILLENLSRELRYNLTVIEDISKNIEKTIPKILSGEKSPYVKLSYHKFSIVFVRAAYEKGVLFEMLSEYDMAVFDDVLNHYINNQGGEWLHGRLEDLESGKIKKEDAVRSFQYEKDDLDNHSRILNDILDKVTGSKK